ncbi:unnamed protein product [Pleuronectes platessa]|uniref:Uncharacterized protein n=1 Tax=Pleuronectes platessa TaxID=8262 RepID=A0A9N7Z8D2_PLEPL|nr:unnamed protein product [Pleuronectes platessa]
MSFIVSFSISLQKEDMANTECFESDSFCLTDEEKLPDRSARFSFESDAPDSVSRDDNDMGRDSQETLTVMLLIELIWTKPEPPEGALFAVLYYICLNQRHKSGAKLVCVMTLDFQLLLGLSRSVTRCAVLSD